MNLQWEELRSLTLGYLGDMAAPVTVVVLVVGLVSCFAGWRIYQAFLVVTGAVLGLAAGAMIGNAAGNDNATVTVIVAVVGAVIGAGLLPVLEPVVVFGSGALLGYWSGMGLASQMNSTLALIVAIAAALVVGGVFLALRKLFVVLGTAVLGAALINAAVQALFGINILVFVPFALGVIVQFLDRSRHSLVRR